MVKKTFVLAFSLFILSLYISCLGKKKLEPEEAVEKPAPPVCSAAQVKLKPDFVENPDLAVGSGRFVDFQASAYDVSGQPVSVDLDWYFRGLPEDADRTMIGQGHKLTKTGPVSASFEAAGHTAGTFGIAAEVPDCTGESGLPVRGTAKVVVNARPGAPALCGPVSILYGRRDVSGETVIGFIPIRLKAELFGPKSMRKHLRVRFYLNGKQIKPDRKLILDDMATPQFSQEAAYWAYIPFWRPAGEYEAYYELRDGEELVCTSNTAYLTAR
jgi:hypothetical protein